LFDIRLTSLRFVIVYILTTYSLIENYLKNMLAYIQRILAGGMIMIDNYLLEELITFAKYKTLAKTAA